ncbi:MAG: orotate phosphoribosyltransferase [Candidatus Omnitrophica bacterium]|nr:orotate phosphoribosyltransferase [Candidatus Omnitrophota bacterium]
MSQISISDCKKRLFEILKTQAFLKGDFTLSSGKKSNYYLDARLVTLSAEGAFLCGKLIYDLVRDKNPTAIGGPTLGADPMVGAVGTVSFLDKTPVKTFIIRKEPKGHGKGKMVEGPELKSADRIVIIDDVATTGKAFIHSIDALAQDGLKPVVCACIIDRQDGAKEALAAKGVELRSLFTATEFLKD